MTAPQGNTCPGCGQPSPIVLDGGRQAFCGNDQCHVMTWDPTRTLAELAADMHTIDVPDWLT